MGFVEKAMSVLSREKNLKFAPKLDLMCLIGRLIGRYKLIYPPFYNFVFKYLRPDLKNPSRLFTFISESVHEASPTLDLEFIISQIIN